MQLRTFGSVMLEGSNFTRPKPLLLLAYLALEGTQDRRFLAELFWPRAGDHMKSLTVALSRIRKGAPGAIEADGSRAWTPLESDAGRFLAYLEEGDLARALELYQGPFLEGLYLRDWGAELEEWVYQTREFLAVQARQALITQAEREALRGHFSEAATRAQRAYHLPGAPALEPEDLRRLYTLLRAGENPHASEVGAEANAFGLELIRSSEAARQQLTEATPTTVVPHNLPAGGTSFVGRDLELTEVASMLAEPDCRMLTLLGPAGVGKTRLGMQVAREQLKLKSFQDGVYLVPLAPLTTVSAIHTNLADVLGLELKGAKPPFEQVVDAIAGQQMLFLLDNFEHLMDAALMVAELLTLCPNLKLLATSRERLNVEEEYVFSLAGLPFPERHDLSPAEAQRYDAINLFVQRAKRSRADFALTATTLPAVLDICRLVEGLPLGLELSAVWLRAMPVREIARELATNLDLLATSTRNIPERHRSIRAAFEQSWKRLLPKEQEVLQNLAVFKGGFGREAASEVAGATIPILASLVDKSLMRADLSGRYDIHPLLRQYALEKLTQRSEVWSAAQERHGRYYLRLLRRCGVGLQGGAQRVALNTLDKEQENLRLAWTYALSQGWLNELHAAAESVNLYYLIRARPQVGLELFSEAVTSLGESLEPEPLPLGTMLLHQAWFYYVLRRFEDASQAASRGLDLLKPLREHQGIAKALNTLGVVAWKTGDYEKASAYYHQALDYIAHDPGAKVRLLGNLAIVEHFQGHYSLAEQYYQQVLAHDREQGNVAGVVQALNNLGHLYLDDAAFERARARFGEALDLARRHAIERITPNLLSGLATVALELGQPSEAQTRFREALSLAYEVGNKTDHAIIALKLARSLREADHTEGWQHLKRGLQTAWEIKDTSIVLYALTVLAEYEMGRARPPRAAELLSLVIHHPATKRSDRDAAQRLADSLQGERPDSDRDDVREPCTTLDLAAAVEALLHENQLQPDATPPQPRPEAQDS